MEATKNKENKTQTIKKKKNRDTRNIKEHMFFVCVAAACVGVCPCVAVWVCPCAGVWLWVSAWCGSTCVCAILGAASFFKK